VSVEPDVLVIGYGNTLRGDDGAGWLAAELLTEDPRSAGAKVLVCQQLTPELAEDVSHAEFLVLVDAAEESTAAGSVSTRVLPSLSPSGQIFSHHVDPGRLLQLATTLFGRCPPAVQVTLRVADVDAGTSLSAPVGAALPLLVDTVIDLIQQHRQRSA
jgi:hydrogenase maturation protease